MKSLVKVLSCLVLVLVLASCNRTNPTLEIEGGKVKGVELTNCIVYKGIPYAAVPVGDLRWRKPQPVEAWDTTLIADNFGLAAVQKIHPADDGSWGTEFYWDGQETGEDCLHLNIWAPKGAPGHAEKKLPVAMWIHGGAFTGGWGFEKEFDGEAWAERGVILVTINYRLGLLGYLCHPSLSLEDVNGVSGNYGMWDQLKALEWVNHNIAQFGGDPDNITIFGQSAGGRSVKNLVASPLAKPYIAKAIIQSAAGISTSTSSPEAIPTQDELDEPAEDMFSLEDIYTSDQMRAASVEQLVALKDNYEALQKRELKTRPHIDGVIFTEDFSTAALDSTLADIPYMIGSTADDPAYLGEGILDFASVRDSLYEKPTYVYYFDAALPDDGRPCLKGSFHSSELWYVFHTLDRSWRPFTDADYNLSDRIVDYWTNFVKYGDPNGATPGEWKPATSKDPFVMKLERK